MSSEDINKIEFTNMPYDIFLYSKKNTLLSLQ